MYLKFLKCSTFLRNITALYTLYCAHVHTLGKTALNYTYSLAKNFNENCKQHFWKILS